MPEGHVIHRLANRLNRDFRGPDLAVSSPQGRFAAEAALLDTTPLRHAEAHGKHLFLHFDAATVHIHLGLIGSLRFGPVAPPRGQVRLRLATDTAAADLRGPQTCRLLTDAAVEKTLAQLGPDPLKTGEHPPSLRRTRRSIAAVLMDQKFFAGVGNIYRAEVLFRLGIDPMTPANQVDVQAVWEDLVDLMHSGVRDGRIDTVRPEHLPEAMGRPPREDDHGGEVYVYRRAGLPCYVCGTPVAQQVLQGRNLFWCPTCQA